MKVVVYRELDLTEQKNVEALSLAMRTGFQMRPASQFRSSVAVTSKREPRRKRKIKRSCYRIEGDLADRIVKLREAGASVPSIAKTVGLSPSGTAHFLRRNAVRQGVAKA